MCERKALDTCHMQDCFNSKRFQAGIAIDVIELSLSIATDGVCHTAVWAEPVKMHWSCASLNIVSLTHTYRSAAHFHMTFHIIYALI